MHKNKILPTPTAPSSTHVRTAHTCMLTIVCTLTVCNTMENNNSSHLSTRQTIVQMKGRQKQKCLSIANLLANQKQTDDASINLFLKHSEQHKK